MLEAGVAQYKDKACDFIIGFGGGPLDSAKAIGAPSVIGGEISELIGKDTVSLVTPAMQVTL